MMLVNHVQSRVCHVTVLADADSLPWSAGNRILATVDLMATGVIVNKQFLKITWSPFKACFPTISVYSIYQYLTYSSH